MVYQTILSDPILDQDALF